MILGNKIGLGLMILGVGSLMAALPATADTVLDTTASWDGSQSIHPWGVGGNTATYGQSITTPADHYLTDFTFYINTQDAINYQSYVYAWDGTKTAGPALFSSTVQSTTPAEGFQAYTTNTGSLDLTAGSQYVLFFSTSGLQAGQPSDLSSWGFTGKDSYVGGDLQFANNGDDLSALGTQQWASFIPGDLAFKANFASTNALATPEPSEVASMGLGVLGLGALMLRARRRRATAS